MTSVGWATLDVIPSFKGLAGQLDKGTSGPLRSAGSRGGVLFGDAAGRSAGSRFGSIFSKAAKASLVGIAGAGALAFKVGADSIEQASDLNESLNAVNVTYGKQAKGVKRLGRESAKALGLSNSQFNGLAVQYSAFARTIGGDKKVVRTLDDLTTRASDFASVMNLEVNDAATLFQSGLAGETEPLRKFGIDLSAAAVNAFAYAEGIAKAGEPLTEAQKVQARYASLMEQTSKTQDDFANTSDSLANRQRILSARWDDARAKLGKGLLPIMEDATGFILNKGIPAFEDFSDWFNDKGIPLIKKFGGFVRDDLSPALKDAAEFAGDIGSAFDNLPGWVKKALIGGTLATVAANKVLPKGLPSLATAAASRAIPVRVFETNPLALGGGSGGLPGGGGKPTALAKGAAKFTIVGAAALYLGNQYLKYVKSDPNKGYTLSSSKDATDPNSVYADPRRRLSSDKLAIYLDAMEKKAQGLGRELDLVGGKKVEPKFAVPGLAEGRAGLTEFLRLQINAGKPITPYINTTSIERAIALARTLDAELQPHSSPERGTDNGVGFQHGGTGDTSPRVVIENMQAHDYNDFLKQTQRRTQSAGIGGF